MSETSISVVVPCRNGARFLSEALASILRQEVAVSEIIVVDDGSTDASAEIAVSYPEVRVLRLDRVGVSEARNHGLHEAQGEFVLFHDADDRLLPCATAIGLEAFATHTSSGFVYGFSRHINEFGELKDTAVHRYVDHASYLTLLRGAIPVPPSTILFRRSVVVSVGGFAKDQALAEDYELCLRVAREYPIHCHGQVVAEYRWHGCNASGRSASRSLRAVLQTLDRQCIAATPEVVQAIREGRHHFSEMFGELVAFEAIDLARVGEVFPSLAALWLALRVHPRGLPVVAGNYLRVLGARTRPVRRI